jgi:anti-anti-sigma factor
VGEIDLATAPDLLSDLHRAARDRPGAVVVDCIDLEFIDGAGLGVLLFIRDELAAEGRALAIVNPPRLLVRLLEILDLTSVLSDGRSARAVDRKDDRLAG